MLRHEGAEQIFRLAHHLGVVFLDRHHGEPAVGIHGDEIGYRRAQRKALDAGAEFLRQQERRIERRRHRRVVFGGYENGLHAHAPHARGKARGPFAPCCYLSRAIILPRGGMPDKLLLPGAAAHCSVAGAEPAKKRLGEAP
jgi:hypothetical protein